MTTITIVGGGIAGLVSAISVAEAGASATLHEAGSSLGGRARTDPAPHRVNLGAHALYCNGGLEAWLRDRGLLPPCAPPRLAGFRIVSRGRVRRLPLPLLPMMRRAREQAPEGRDYRSWATERMGERAAEAAIGFASLPTFHHDPGVLDAAFVQERIARSLMRPAVTYVLGGWAQLIGMLEARARALGVHLETGSKLSQLPEGPTIVATDLPAAARLLADPKLEWPGPRTALLDVAFRGNRRDPGAVLDLDERVYASRYSAVDPSLAPEGESLVQAVAGVRPGETATQATERIEGVLDRSFPDWRSRLTWRRTGVVDGGAGPADPPGSSWRDRPAIDRGSGVWLAGDKVAAPGILSEASFESARLAAEAAVAKVSG